MVPQTSDVAARFEFLAVVLADPDLLDVAFDEVIASWEAEPPRPPDRTLVATSERRDPPSLAWRASRDRQSWPTWIRAVPRPRVARSPPERSMVSLLVTSARRRSSGSARWKTAEERR
jgi:hypothetical protein